MAAEKRKAMRSAISLIDAFEEATLGADLAHETPVLEDREVMEYASWDAYAVVIDKSLGWLR